MREEIKELLELIDKYGFREDARANAIAMFFADKTLTFEEFKELENDMGYNVNVSIEPNCDESVNNEDEGVCIDFADATMIISESKK